MTVAATPYKESYAGNGVTTVFSVPFYFLADTDLVVSDVNNTTGVITPLVLNVDYTVTGTGTPTGGAVTVTTATATGHTLTIERSLVEDQPTHFVDGDPLPASGLEQALDRIVMLYQQAKTALDRAAKFAVGSPSSSDLPEPQEGYVLGWVGGKLKNLSAATAQLGADLLSTVVGKGAALISYLAPYTGAAGRTQQSKNTDWVSVDDFISLSAALASGVKQLVFGPGPYTVAATLNIPDGMALKFNNTVIHAHFSGFVFSLLNYGNQKFLGKLSIIDNDASVVSAATTITKGIQFGATATAVHGVDTTGCDIYCENLLQAYYFGEFSWTNAYGSLRSYRCGNATTPSLFMNTDGVNAPNDSSFLRVDAQSDNTATWNGMGPQFNGNGVVVNSLHVESIYNSTGCNILSKGFKVNGGYLENAGGTATSGTIIVDATATASFSGVLVNCPLNLGSRSVFTGCRFFKTDLHKNATYIGCKFPNANQLVLDLTGLTTAQLPRFGASSANVPLTSSSGNFAEWGVGYSLSNDFDYYGGNHALTVSATGFSTQIAADLNTPGAVYTGAVGWNFEYTPTAGTLYAWAIVKVASAAQSLLVGVGGVTGSGSYDVNGITNVLGSTFTGWALVVQPDVTPFTSATYSSKYGIYFEGPQSLSGDRYIDSFGIEIGGISYHNLASKNAGNPSLNMYRRASAMPTTGTWTIGKVVSNSAPTNAAGVPAGWVRVTNGSGNVLNTDWRAFGVTV